MTECVIEWKLAPLQESAPISTEAYVFADQHKPIYEDFRRHMKEMFLMGLMTDKYALHGLVVCPEAALGRGVYRRIGVFTTKRYRHGTPDVIIQVFPGLGTRDELIDEKYYHEKDEEGNYTVTLV
jgi:hypothetical protein